MIFTETQLKGPFILNLERREDSRGFFARASARTSFAPMASSPPLPRATWHRRRTRSPSTVRRRRRAARRPARRGLRLRQARPQGREILDEYGHYMTYGEAVNAPEMRRENYLPEGLVEGCKLKRDIPEGAVITYADVDLPPGRLADQLRVEQYEYFKTPTS